jgi:WD40 repeat protein
MKKLILIIALCLIPMLISAQDKVKLAWHQKGQLAAYSGMCVSESENYAFSMFTGMDSLECGKFICEIQMWNLNSGVMEKAFPLPVDYYFDYDFDKIVPPEIDCNADETRLLVFRPDSAKYHLFDIESGEMLADIRMGVFDVDHQVRFAKLTDDGSMFLTRLSKRDYLSLNFAETGKTAIKIPLPEGADDYGCITTDGLYFSTYYSDSTVKVINTVSGEIEQEFELDFECRVRAISDNMKFIYCTQEDSTCVLYDTELDTIVWEYTSKTEQGNTVCFKKNCEFSPTMEYCLVSSDDIERPLIIPLLSFNYEHFSIKQPVFGSTFSFYKWSVSSYEFFMAFDTQMNFAVLNNAYFDIVDTIGTNFEASTHFGEVTGIAYDRNNNQIATSSSDYSIKFWDDKSGVLVGTVEDKYDYTDIDFSRSYFTASCNNTIRSWKSETYDRGSVIDWLYQGEIINISYMPGRYSKFPSILAYINQKMNAIGMIDGYGGQGTPQNEDTEYPYSCMAWSNSGTKLFGGLGDDKIEAFEVVQNEGGDLYIERDTLINLANPHTKTFTTGIKEIEFSPDDSKIIVLTESNDVAIMLDAETYEELPTPSGEFPLGGIHSVEFLGNSGLVAYGTKFGAVYFYDLHSRTQLESNIAIAQSWEGFDMNSPIRMFADHMKYIEEEQLLIVGTNYGSIAALDVSELIETSSISDIEPVQLRVYPNPARDFLKIDAPVNSKIKIFDLTGRVILETFVVEIDLSSFASGMYIVSVETGGKVLRQKLIVE